MRPAIVAMRFLLVAGLLCMTTAVGPVYAIDGPGVPTAPALDGRDASLNETEPADSESVNTPPAKAKVVLEAIQKRHGEPPPGYVGGRFFYNRERRLPHGRYREYDINPKIPGQNRGTERLVIEQMTGKAYYTDDHYRTFIPMN